MSTNPVDPSILLECISLLDRCSEVSHDLHDDGGRLMSLDQWVARYAATYRQAQRSVELNQALSQIYDRYKEFVLVAAMSRQICLRHPSRTLDDRLRRATAAVGWAEAKHGELDGRLQFLETCTNAYPDLKDLINHIREAKDVRRNAKKAMDLASSHCESIRKAFRIPQR